MTRWVMADGIREITKNSVVEMMRIGTTEVVIPESVTTISTEAFYTPVLSEGRHYPFQGCEDSASITPSNHGNILHSHDKGTPEFKDLKSIVIPASVSSIGVRAFYGCSGLKFIILPDEFCDEDNIKRLGIIENTTVISSTEFNRRKEEFSHIIKSKIGKDVPLGSEILSYLYVEDWVAQKYVPRNSLTSQSLFAKLLSNTQTWKVLCVSGCLVLAISRGVAYMQKNGGFQPSS